MGVDSFLNQTLQELTDCLFWFIHTMKMREEKGILPLDIIYQKVLLIIITSSMEKTNQLILI